MSLVWLSKRIFDRERLRWVHTCNVTAHRNAVTLQVTDTIRSYELNFHPMPHGVTVSCEHYTAGFPVCYGSPSDVFAASKGLVHLYTGCPRRNVPDFGRVFLMLKYTDITQNTYVQS